MGRDLTNLYIDQSFEGLVQISGSQLTDGTGSLITNLDVTASNAVTASYLTGTIASASYAVSSSHAVNADNATSASHALVADLATNATNAINSQHADNTVVTIKNLEATQIDKGTPCYITDSGTGGNIVGVYRADAALANRMPAGVIAGEDLAPGAEGLGYLDGYIQGVDTHLFTAGDAIYVAPGGGYQNTRPTGSAVKVQAIGYVAKSAINGSGVIQGSGRANDVPNLPSGQIFVGDGGGTYAFVNTGSLSVASAQTAVSASHAVTSSHSLISEDLVSTADININSIQAASATFTSASIGYLQSVTGSAKIIGDAFIILNNDTPTERYAGIVVQDSGSGAPNTTASLEFDGQTNDWFYEYSTDGGVTTDHGVAMFGPEYSVKGSPTYNANNTLLKGTGGHHIADSNIADDGALVSINSNTRIVGDLELSGSGADLNFYQNSPSEFPTNIKFWSGSTQGTNYIQMQTVPGSNGILTISAFPNNDHFVFMDPSDFTFQIPATVTGGPGLPLIVGSNGIYSTGSITTEGNITTTSGHGVVGGEISGSSGKFDGNVTLTAGDLYLYPGVNIEFSNGYANQNLSAPTSFQEKSFVNMSGASISGKAYNRAFFGVADYAAFGLQFEDYFAIEYYDSFGYNYGGELNVNGKQLGMFISPSGSGASQKAELRVTDNYDGTSTANVQGSTVSIGTAVTNQINIGRAGMSGDTSIVGSLVTEDVNVSSGRSTAHVDAITVVGGGTSTMDCSAGNFFTIALNANTTLTATNITAGQTISVRVANSGANTMAFDTMFRFAGGTAPTITSSGTDVLTFISFDGTNLESTAVQNLS